MERKSGYSILKTSTIFDVQSNWSKFVVHFLPTFCTMGVAFSLKQRPLILLWKGLSFFFGEARGYRQRFEYALVCLDQKILSSRSTCRVLYPPPHILCNTLDPVCENQIHVTGKVGPHHGKSDLPWLVAETVQRRQLNGLTNRRSPCQPSQEPQLSNGVRWEWPSSLYVINGLRQRPRLNCTARRTLTVNRLGCMQFVTKVMWMISFQSYM